MIKQAFVLGAGLGTRLRPLTDDLPKPLVPIFQKPLITFAFDHLIDAGITKFFVNTHRQKERFADFFPGAIYRDRSIGFRHEPVLLETGGGIKNIQDLLGTEPFIVYSGDILTDVDLAPLIDEHFRRKNDVTLGLRKTGLDEGVVLRDNQIVAIRKKGEPPGDYDFAGISIWNAGIFDRIPPATKISFIPILVDWIRQGGRIGGVVLEREKMVQHRNARGLFGSPSHNRSGTLEACLRDGNTMAQLGCVRRNGIANCKARRLLFHRNRVFGR